MCTLGLFDLEWNCEQFNSFLMARRLVNVNGYASLTLDPRKVRKFKFDPLRYSQRQPVIQIRVSQTAFPPPIWRPSFPSSLIITINEKSRWSSFRKRYR